MREDDDYVTVFRSGNANHVDVVVSALEAHGIPCTHPGRHHAQMLGGLQYVQVEVRVPALREAAARSLLADMFAPAPDDGEGVTLRLVRDRRMEGGCLGWLLGMCTVWVMVAASVVASRWFTLAVVFVLASVGAVLGSRSPRDICARPSCGAHLLPAAEECPKCGARVAGSISEPSEYLGAIESIEAEQRRARGANRAHV